MRFLNRCAAMLALATAIVFTSGAGFAAAPENPAPAATQGQSLIRLAESGRGNWHQRQEYEDRYRRNYGLEPRNFSNQGRSYNRNKHRKKHSKRRHKRRDYYYDYGYAPRYTYPRYSGRCADIHYYCEAEWGRRSGDYFACMRDYGCR